MIKLPAWAGGRRLGLGVAGGRARRIPEDVGAAHAQVLRGDVPLDEELPLGAEGAQAAPVHGRGEARGLRAPEVHGQVAAHRQPRAALEAAEGAAVQDARPRASWLALAARLAHAVAKGAHNCCN